MRRLLAAARAALAWLADGHYGTCAGCERNTTVRASLDGLALLCRHCDRRSFGGVPSYRGRFGALSVTDQDIDAAWADPHCPVNPRPRRWGR